jgi:hypothetical protein
MIRIIILSLAIATLTGCALFIPEGQMSMSVSEAPAPIRQ